VVQNLTYFHVKWVRCHHCMARPRLPDRRDGISYLYISRKPTIHLGRKYYTIYLLCSYYPVGLITMSLNKTYSIVRIRESQYDKFTIRKGLKQGEALSQLLFSFAFEYMIQRIQENREGLKLNGTH
jgi:hypothetical protein